MLVEQSTEGGSLLQEDARLLEGVFEFSEKTAQEVMTPRTQMAALDADLTVEAGGRPGGEHGRSRYPVYTESLDEIIGVVHAKDILAALRSRPGQTIRIIMRPPLFVPGTREVEDVLADMKRLKTHLAIVLDEYGGTAGLVTMEDLLEEIVGPDLRRVRPPGSGRTRPRARPSWMARCRSPSSMPSSMPSWTTPTIPPSAATSSASSAGCRRPGDRVTVGPVHVRGGRDGRPEGQDDPAPRFQAGRSTPLQAGVATSTHVPHLHRRDSSRRARPHR